MRPLIAGLHFSVAYLGTRTEEVLSQAARYRAAGFTLTYHGRPIGFLQLASDAAKPGAPNRATPQPPDAAPRVPMSILLDPTVPDPEDQTSVLRNDIDLDDLPDDMDDDTRAVVAELMQASDPPAT